MRVIVKVFVFIIFCSCQHNRESLEEIDKRFEKLNFQFASSGNEVYLDSILIEIHKTKYFNSHTLTTENVGYVSNAFLRKKRFITFINLLNKSSLPEKERAYLLNLVSAYKEFSEGREVVGKHYINKNIKYLSDEIKLNDKNSLACFDLLYMKSHLLSKKEIGMFLDSLCLKRESFCTDYNKEAITNSISSYLKEYNEIIN